MIRYLEEIKKGQKNDDLILNLDLAPTILDFAGVEIPGHMQGKSFKNRVTGEDSSAWREAVYYHYMEDPKA